MKTNRTLAALAVAETLANGAYTKDKSKEADSQPLKIAQRMAVL